MFPQTIKCHNQRFLKVCHKILAKLEIFTFIGIYELVNIFGVALLTKTYSYRMNLRASLHIEVDVLSSI